MRVPRTFVLVCTATLALAACERGHDAPAADADAEMTWARAALERNPNLDVLAVDAKTGVFTVRDRRSGEVQAVKAADLAAAPVAQLSPGTARRMTQADPASDAEEAFPEEPQAGSDAVETESSATQATSSAGGPLDYTVERQGDKVRVSGPGVSIVSAGTQAPATAKGEPGQRVVDPLICDGPRMMQVDNRQIFVDGDAITARNGCELHITNSRIVASGTGVIARDATVHITNSYIEGTAGSYDAGPGAKVFLRGATLHGTMRRDPSAEIHEREGSQWR